MSLPTEFSTFAVPVRGGPLAGGVWHRDARGLPLLAVHGITANHRSWSLVADALPGTRVIAPDLRGRGRSNTLPGPFGLIDHADDLARLLDGLEVDRAVVAGHSMGGFVGVRFAERHPDRVASLVLVDGGLPLPPPPGIPPEEAAAAALGPAIERLGMCFASRDDYAQFWRRHPGLGPYWNEAVADYVDYDLTGEEPELHPSAASEAVAANVLELDGSAGYAAALSALSLPIDFVRAPRGLLDQPEGLYTPATVAAWAERMPSLRTQKATDVNHYTIVMSPAGVTQLLPVLTRHFAPS